MDNDVSEALMTEHFFEYGSKETDYLCSKDKRLAEVIRSTGHIYRRVIPDLYSALVHSIVGQQISTKAHETIWRRIQEKLGNVIPPERIEAMSLEEVQGFGLSFRKAGYIKCITHKITCGEFSLDELHNLSDKEVCKRLSSLDGIGQWTAEMLMLFSMQRPDILSYNDLAIIRGMQRVYHHREIKSETFERIRSRLSPCCSVASLYFWKVAGGQG